MDSNSLFDGAFHSLTLTGLVFAGCMAADKLLKIKPPNLAKADIKDVSTLAVSIFGAEMVRNWLVKLKIIPDNVTLE